MKTDHSDETDVATALQEQATHWWVVLHGESASAADRREFGEWVARSPERIAAYLRTERLMRALASDQVSWPASPAEELIREAKAAPAGVVPMRRLVGGPPGRLLAKTRSKVAIAAALVLAVAVGWLVAREPQRYSTALGEQRSVLLDDGSLVTLNTSSRIELVMDKHKRTVRLLAGEALFQVAHDSSRPFDVIAGDTTVRAVGTQFNVDRRAVSTTVTVVEGKVAVSAGSAAPSAPSMLLGAAERTVITATAVSSPERVANLAAATAWTQRRLVFERRPLGEVAEEFNRYNRQLIHIDDAGLRDEQVTGVFEANDPESFVTFLSSIPGVTLQRSEDRISVARVASADAG